MRYLLLIYGKEADRPPPGTAESGALWSEYRLHETMIRERGELVAGGALHPTTAATTIQVNSEVVLASDGPSEDTINQLCGYFVVNVEDLDEAIEIASSLPGARHGSVEVRPVMEVPG